VTVTPVQVGLVTSSLAQIMSGISDGQAVVTGTTSSLNSTSGGTTGFPGGGITGGGNFPAGGFRPGGGGRTVTSGN
jgi:hypothetical protein